MPSVDGLWPKNRWKSPPSPTAKVQRRYGDLEHRRLLPESRNVRRDTGREARRCGARSVKAAKKTSRRVAWDPAIARGDKYEGVVEAAA